MLVVHRYHDISCGHRVAGHEGHCAHLHGHNYRIHFVCTAPRQDALGRIIDFSVIKARLCQWLEETWDHRFIVWEEDPLRDGLIALDPSVVTVPFNPTAEAMAAYLVDVIGPQQLADLPVRLIECRVEETAKCGATYNCSP